MGDKGHLKWCAATVCCSGRDQILYVPVVHCGQTVIWYGIYDIYGM